MREPSLLQSFSPASLSADPQLPTGLQVPPEGIHVPTVAALSRRSWRPWINTSKGIVRINNNTVQKRM